MMNSEENRLRSFDAWDSTPLRMDLKRELACNGFFATEIFAEAECAWCHCTLGVCNDWLQHTPTDVRHELLNPNCPFIVNYETSGNIRINANKRKQPPASVTATALLPPPTKQKRSEADGVDMFVEANRLATFGNWPNPNISPQSLAKAGFYYLNCSDMVKCAWCKGVIGEWEKEDTAFEEHRRFFPDCPKVKLGPPIEIASDAIRDLGIQQITAPKLSIYSSLDARLRTYTEWPISDIQQPEALAQAGLYYQNLNDEVRCFQCNIVLLSWQKEDDPWFEHAKGNPQCSFVQQVKGVAYVQQVQEIVRQNRIESEEALNQSQAEAPIAENRGSLVRDVEMPNEENEEIARQNDGTLEEPHASVCPPRISIDEAMSTIPVKQALEMGIDAGCIRNATQRCMCATGKPYSTVEDLLMAIFDNRMIATNMADVSAGTSANLHTTGTTTAMVGVAAEEKRVDTKNSSHENATLPTQSLSLEEERDLRELKDAHLCKVCLAEEVAVAFVPCGHLATCVQCAPRIVSIYNKCPMCRADIDGSVRIHFA